MDEVNKILDNVEQVQETLKEYAGSKKAIDEAIKKELERKKAETEEILSRIKW